MKDKGFAPAAAANRNLELSNKFSTGVAGRLCSSGRARTAEQPLIPTHDNWCAITIHKHPRSRPHSTHCTSPAAHRLSSEHISNGLVNIVHHLVAYLEPFIIVGGCLCRFLLHSHEKQAEVTGGKASSQASTSPHPQYRRNSYSTAKCPSDWDGRIRTPTPRRESAEMTRRLPPSKRRRKRLPSQRQPRLPRRRHAAAAARRAAAVLGATGARLPQPRVGAPNSRGRNCPGPKRTVKADTPRRRRHLATLTDPNR